jgi:hypothetical protein
MIEGRSGETPLFRLLCVLLLSATGGCSSTSTDFGQPLSITLTADRDVAVAGVDTVTFRYDAAGTDLVGIVLNFGDGQVDSLSAQGATTAGATREHLYSDPGTFFAVAEVLEAFGGSLADTVVIEVRSP